MAQPELFANPIEPDPKTQKGRILALLRRGRDQGYPVDNVMLCNIGFRYSARIQELRKDGHNIVTGPTSSTGVTTYKLEN